MRFLVPSALALCAITLAAPAADACSLAGPEPHELDPAEKQLDTAPPGPPTVVVDSIQRGQGAFLGLGANSCDDLGMLRLRVEATDDRTPPDKLGYEFVVGGGEPPKGFRSHPGAVRSGPRSVLFAWSDGATNSQESFDFTMDVTAIDLAGNRSKTVQLRIEDGGGCGCGSAGGLDASAAAVLALIFGLRRRRRPSPGQEDSPP